MNKSRVHKPKRWRIEIPIIARPPTYTRGSGPPLAPLKIALQNDSTAYITDKEVVPLSDNEEKLQMHYIVRWTDLPAASVAIPATHITSYVSSRTLEDFEYKLSLEKEEQQLLDRKIEETRKVNNQVPLTPTGPGKKRGRPIKPAAAGVILGPLGENAAPLSLVNISGPSLSTPQKSLRLDENIANDTDDVDDEVEEDDAGEDGSGEQDTNADAAIFDQLYREATVLVQADNAADIPTATPRHSLSSQVTKMHISPKLTLDSRHSPTSMFRGAQPSASRPRRLVQTSLSSSGFVPAGCGSTTWPSPSQSQSQPRNLGRLPNMTTQVSTLSNIQMLATSSSRKKKKHEGFQPPLDEEDAAWEVKRLESDRVIDIDGELQRWFRVRWEGNWPAHQNPTWEPQENLPSSLVKKYLKKKAARGGNDVAEEPDDLEASRPPAPPNNEYPSVADAFGDESELAAMVRHDPTPRRADGDDKDRLLVDSDGENQKRIPLLAASLPVNGSFDFAQARGLLFNGQSPGS
ncbi:uncharacterized protein BCR38DRAFT_486751 [Pseudomassariella vexata]|uniref:Chromo domain-containing protein n=1 Tax=Pseudomassariella vexata TaxID=1141098 RepID=A0A1Y2DT80_9PEZI|nr:uncharacterized protein BCR38DRAFT_486751 [Pseudomassariella vexata]ORY62481.1 hypothetical protein BCR38DRAFT_486751 [Pseudomassariella vexata]